MQNCVVLLIKMEIIQAVAEAALAVVAGDMDVAVEAADSDADEAVDEDMEADTVAAVTTTTIIIVIMATMGITGK